MSDKVLFVDDEPAVLEGFRRTLRGKFEVVTAVSGEQGLAAIRDHGPFGVVISDLQMPEMDGVQFLARVRQVAPNSIRLILTGHAELNTAISAINEGHIFGFLSKPCQEKDLVRTIAAALVEHNKRKEERVRIQIPVQLYRFATDARSQLATPWKSHAPERGWLGLKSS